MHINLSLILLLLTRLLACQAYSASAEELLPVIPQPTEIVRGDGACSLSGIEKLILLGDIESSRIGVEQLQNSLACLGFSVPIVVAEDDDIPTRRSIRVDATGLKDEPLDESYSLEIRADRIDISANSPAGIYYACQTLRQMLDSTKLVQDGSIPCETIRDGPQFAWRGLLVDVARHFFPVEDLKKFIDLMAYYKLNRLHLHLTDDQGWRLPVDALPRLTSVGAYRKGAAGDLTGNRPPDSDRYGGFYTKQQLSDLVAYASARNVTVVPEIEMPGHATAALAAYPHVSCDGGPYEVENRLGIFHNNFCPGKEETFKFVKAVIEEVVEMFPSEFIHVGGDEVRLPHWEACPDCQRRVADEKLAGVKDLQSYFVRRVEALAAEHGRRVALWEEASAEDLSDHAVVMSWLGVDAGVQAANSSRDVVFCPHQSLYFDYTYDANCTREAYHFTPMPEGLHAESLPHVLGAQGNLWTEHINTLPWLYKMTVPRGVASAEALWSAPDSPDWSRFVRRLKLHKGIWEKDGISHHPLPGMECQTGKRGNRRAVGCEVDVMSEID